MEHYVHQYIIGMDTNPAETELNLRSIIQAIESNETGLSGLVVVMQEFLVSEEANLRAKGLSLLTGVLKGIPKTCVTSKDVGVFSQFYVDRLHDQYCISELLNGLNALLSLNPACGPQDTLKIVQG
ncbi:hypothetical protein DSO57_1015100 [Entomophthora muscae]|uniref:Uncharacterized protein n=1 Tax=Entomophthora muscae TaxID=34485 RepID=A0ACC2U3H2_9FUNG|nr:hypothetical protein DSO57_1015100 [Entomophthora muscae]